MAKKKISIWEQRILSQKERLLVSSRWFPLPALVAFGLLMLFGGHLLPGVNPRSGSPASVMVFDSEKTKDGAIWISLSLKEGRLVVTTHDRVTFSVDLTDNNKDNLDPLVEYLKKQSVEKTLAAGLMKEMPKKNSRVVIASDATLRFVHMQPILKALATAGLANYGFETKLPRSMATM